MLFISCASCVVLLPGLAAISRTITQNAYYNGGYKYASTGLASHYDQGGGFHSWYYAPSGTAGNAISFVQALTLNTNGVLGLQGSNTSATGVGVAFPATQSASSDANTLDDYETGTFTPVIIGSATNPTVTYSFQLGTYTKIGNIVNYSIDIRWNGLSGGGGSVGVAGLPFTANASYGRYIAAIETYTNSFTGSYLVAECVDSSTQLSLTGISTAGTATAVTVANLATTGIAFFRITGSYRVA